VGEEEEEDRKGERRYERARATGTHGHRSGAGRAKLAPSRSANIFFALGAKDAAYISDSFPP